MAESLKTSRQQDRAALRRRADRVLLGFLGRAISRPDRRLVARAYANAAYRLSQGKPQISGRYSRYQGKPVVLSAPMLHWIAFGDKVLPATEPADGQA